MTLVAKYPPATHHHEGFLIKCHGHNREVLNILLTISIFLAGVFLAFAIPFGIHASDFRLFPIEIGIFRFVEMGSDQAKYLKT